MANKQIDLKALVDTLDPGRNTRKEVNYVWGNGKVVKKQYPTQPGQTYRWGPGP